MRPPLRNLVWKPPSPLPAVYYMQSPVNTPLQNSNARIRTRMCNGWERTSGSPHTFERPEWTGNGHPGRRTHSNAHSQSLVMGIRVAAPHSNAHSQRRDAAHIRTLSGLPRIFERPTMGWYWRPCCCAHSKARLTVARVAAHIRRAVQYSNIISGLYA